MSEHRGFWFVLGAVLAAIGAAVAWLLGRRTRPASTSAQVSALEEAREAEEKRIREEIHSESDQQLADRFNRLAEGKKEKKP